MSRVTFQAEGFGVITVTARQGKIVALDFGVPVLEHDSPSGDDTADGSVLREAVTALKMYFRSRGDDIDLPLAPAGTDYQRRVWEADRNIPRGQTRTYGEMARIVGGSPRSIGGANRENPIPILIPCHRVCAWNGIGGYAGTTQEGFQLQIKRRLLHLEGVHTPR